MPARMPNATTASSTGVGCRRATQVLTCHAGALPATATASLPQTAIRLPGTGMRNGHASWHHNPWLQHAPSRRTGHGTSSLCVYASQSPQFGPDTASQTVPEPKQRRSRRVKSQPSSVTEVEGQPAGLSQQHLPQGPALNHSGSIQSDGSNASGQQSVRSSRESAASPASSSSSLSSQHTQTTSQHLQEQQVVEVGIEDESQYGFDFMPSDTSLLLAAASHRLPVPDADTWGSASWSGVQLVESVDRVDRRGQKLASKSHGDSSNQQAGKGPTSSVPWGTYVKGKDRPRSARTSSSASKPVQGVSAAADLPGGAAGNPAAQSVTAGLSEDHNSASPSPATSSSSSSSRWMDSWFADTASDQPHQQDTAQPSKTGNRRDSRGRFLDEPAEQGKQPAQRGARLDTSVTPVQQQAKGSAAGVQASAANTTDVWVEDWGGYTRSGSGGGSMQALPQDFWWQMHVEAAARSAPPEVLKSVIQDPALNPVQEGGSSFKQAGDADTTLFVKGLYGQAPEALMRAALVAAFSQAGEVLQVRLPSRDLGGGARELKGIAFLVFRDAAAKARALAMPPPVVLGRWVKLDAEPGTSAYGRGMKPSAGNPPGRNTTAGSPADQGSVNSAGQGNSSGADKAGRKVVDAGVLPSHQAAEQGTSRRRGRYLG